MKAVRILAAAALTLVLAAPSFAQTILRNPGQYPVNVAIDTSIIPIPVPGTPQLGPNLYGGTLTIRDAGAFLEARFQGTDVNTGDPLNINCRFDHSWIGFTVMTVPFGGQLVQNVVTGVDGANLRRMRINGVGKADGFTSQVKAEIGPGPTLIRWVVQ
jgi:hypothetical protein